MMETAGIDELIINSVAFSFLLEIDNMILTILVDDDTQELLALCEDLTLPGTVCPKSEVRMGAIFSLF